VVTTARLSSAATTDGPEAFIGGLGDRALALLGRPRAAVSRSELAALLDAAVDLRLLARLALGRHWNVASETQRREYIELFRAERSVTSEPDRRGGRAPDVLLCLPVMPSGPVCLLER
jgi:ABC-type transporter MlaC component